VRGENTSLREFAIRFKYVSESFCNETATELLNALCGAVHRDIAAKNAKFLTMPS